MYKILIRPLEQNDSEVSWKWRNDEEVWKYTGSRPNISVTPEIEREWINKVLNQTNSRRFAITVDDKYIGNIQLTNITIENAEYHIFIGDKDYWGKGVGLSATQQIIRFAKNVLKLKQVYLFVKKENENAIKLYQKCGFLQVNDEVKMTIDLSQTKQPDVSVFCMVYNHEPFLEQCLEGFLMQKCLFDFEIVVGEDCSKDKSREILFRYQSMFPGKFKLLLHDQNIGAVKNQNIVLFNCTGKYIAMCEGDDYWTDPLKLQKQVNFLNENLDFYGHAHQCNIIEDGKKNIIFKDKIKEILTVNDLIEGRLFHTATLMFRNEAKQIFNQIGHNVLSGDRLLFLSIAFKGKIYFSDEIMCIYRKHSGGISSTVRVDQILKDLYPISFLKKIYPKFPALRYKSYVYTTIALCNKATIFQKTYYLFMAFLTSFSYFPKNIVKFKKYFFR